MLFKKNIIYFIFAMSPIFLAASCDSENGTGAIAPPPVSTPVTDADVALYLSTSDGVSKFALQDEAIPAVTDSSLTSISVNTNTSYQEMDGFGFTMTGGSAKLLSEMSKTERTLLLEELFDADYDNIGTSYLRLSMGASDLDEYTFSYNEVDGDVDMTNFDLGYDYKYLIPILKKVVSINPDMKFMSVPWSAPTWMKDNTSTVGGSLLPEYYSAYALYFVKYVQAMAAEGIVVDAVSLQNEPLHGGNNPSMLMTTTEQAEFIKSHLGPAFEAANITAKIVIYDHNCDKPEYPIAILDDAEANAYIDGSAFHLYAGDISALSTVHNAHPDKNIYFTEQWIGAPGSFGDDILWHTEQVLVGSTRNWSKIALEWNLASDTENGPHTDGGCTECLGAVTIDGSTVTRNPAYYIIAHVAKFVRPGSVRIESTYSGDLPNVAFLTEDDKVVLLVANASGEDKAFNVGINDESFSTTLAAGAVGTFVVEL